MATGRLPPEFHPPKVIQSPEVERSLSDTAFIQDGILYRTFRTIGPLDPQELNVSSRSFSFYILDKVALINPHK